MKTCEDCDGAGGCCSISGESPDNCPIEEAPAGYPTHDCERDSWSPCQGCDGRGEVDDDEDEENDETFV